MRLPQAATVFASTLFLCTCVSAQAARPPATAPLLRRLDAIYPQLDRTYCDLHEHPELSNQEASTSQKLAAELTKLGLEVTPNVGGHGLVALLKNGNGPTVMVRAELDALPVEEKTGASYASKVTAPGPGGTPVHVMHACGHDLHMTLALGAAALLAASKDSWRGTFMLVGQPAEEKLTGARAMLADGLFTRFPKPDFALSLHDSDDVPAGQVTWVSGYTLANVNSVDVTIFGRGGHGATPQLTVDPVVIGARIVTTLQTIVGREIDPREAAVVTVGSFHAGTTNNIIPDEAKLQLTVRSFKDDVHKHLLASIERIVKSECTAAGAEKEPIVNVLPGVPAVWNDPAMTKRVATALREAMGPQRVVEGEPAMAGDDFAEYGKAGVPEMQLRLGAVDPQKFAAAKSAKTPLPSLHSPTFLPDRERSIRTGVTAETVAVLALLGRP